MSPIAPLYTLVFTGGLPMRRVFPMAVLSLAVVSGGLISVLRAADEKPKYTIKEVMTEHKKGKLKDKVIDGSASADDKKKLVAMYEAMAKNKPPKGDAESWKKLNDALIKASKEVEEGKDGGVDALKKAVNCSACHKEHKPS
jgi:hypothetical protein